MLTKDNNCIIHNNNDDDNNSNLLFFKVFSAISSSALPALLPSLSRYTLRLDSTGYGILFGLFGLGTIIGGIIIVPRAIKKISPDQLIVFATSIFSISLIALGTPQSSCVICCNDTSRNCSAYGIF